MSESTETEQKTNPQGDPITSVKVETKPGVDPHAEAKKQRVVTPEHMFFEAPRERQFITGSEAGKEAIRRANVDFSIAYPITPQSETMQLIGVLFGEGYIKEYYRGEEEYGVMSTMAGASRAGVRCFTATAGPGTLRGLEPIVSWPGHRLPAVAIFTCRVVNAPLAIQPDNIEIAYLLHSGMIVLHAENQQDVFDFILKSFIISEKNDVTLPVGIAYDGFFVTHARGYVWMTPKDMKLPPRDAYHGSVPVLDAENPPARLSRDAPVQKSNFMSYNIHNVWQQEVWAANERARKYLNYYMGGLLEVQDPGADIQLVASGSAAAQSREAVRLLAEKGIRASLVKIRSLRPFPARELQQACANSKLIVCPEYNYIGWMAKEVKSALYGELRQPGPMIVGGPRVFGGMSMPVELIVDTVMGALKKIAPERVSVPAGSKKGGQDPNEMTEEDRQKLGHFMQNM
jgi:pyruvate ferredoxin oxidoreductase alpha subunit